MWKWARCGLVPRGPPNGLKVAASSPSPPAWRPPPPTPIHPAVSAGDGGSPFCRALACTASPLGPQPLRSNQLNLDLAGHWSSPLTLPLSHLIAALHRVCPTQVVGPWVLDTSDVPSLSLPLLILPSFKAEPNPPSLGKLSPNFTFSWAPMKATVPLYNQTGAWCTRIPIFCVETMLDCTISRTAGAEMYTRGTFVHSNNPIAQQ